MYYFKAFLAATFVTAVVATPIRVPIRRDQLGDLTGPTYDKAFLSLETLNAAIQNLSALPPNEDEGHSPEELDQFQEAMLDYTGAIVNVNATANLVRATRTLPSNISQEFISKSILPLFVLLNDSAIATGQQIEPLSEKLGGSAVIECRNSFDLLSSVKDNLEDAIESSDSVSVQLLKSFTTPVDSNFNATDAIIANLLAPPSISAGGPALAAGDDGPVPCPNNLCNQEDL